MKLNSPASQISTRAAYAFQGVAVLLWWIGMLWVEGVLELFSFPGMSDQALLSFLAPDLIILVAGSLLLSWKLMRPLQWLVLGGCLYASLWCVQASWFTGGAWLGTIVMGLATCFNLLLVLGDELYRVSSTNSRSQHRLHTLLQSVVIWTLCLGILPCLIEYSLGNWPLSSSPATFLPGALCFILSSSLGIWSGWVMSGEGAGTPLPLSTARHLVTQGPYAYLRNPMAVAGLAQGFSVALILGSWAVAIYTLLGMLVWNFFVRPGEEANLELRFGKAFQQYRREVRCWIPRLHPYQSS